MFRFLKMFLIKIYICADSDGIHITELTSCVYNANYFIIVYLFVRDIYISNPIDNKTNIFYEYIMSICL